MTSAKAQGRGVLLVGALPPPSGGVATHVEQLARALRARGVRVRIVDPRREGPDGRDGRLRFAWALALARLRGDLVHVHTNGHNRKSWLLAAAASESSSLLTLHSGLAPDYIRAHPALVARVAARYARVVAVNTDIAAALAAVGVDPERVVVSAAFSPAALDLVLAPPGLRALRRRHDLLIAAALAPGPEYGASVLFDGFARVHARRPGAGLIVYGPGTRAPALADDVAARGLRGAVHFFGEQPRERALAIVTAADVFVRPTLADGDSLSVREALALGRPVVASAVGTRPAEAVLFPAGDAAQMVEAIFHAVGKSDGTPTSTADCIPALTALYTRLGVAERPDQTIGTELAIDW